MSPAPGGRTRRRSLVIGPAVIGVLALLAAACGRREREASPRAPSPIPAPDASLLPIVPPPGKGLDAGALQRMRRGELYLEGLLAAGRTGRQDLGFAYGELGKVYHAFGLPESAAPCYENAARLQPSVFEWPYLLGRALGQRDRETEALAAMQKALALEPDDIPALVFVGDRHRKAGRLEPAKAAYGRAVEISPRCAAALYGLGGIALLEGEFPRAIQLFERALQSQPQASRIHYPLSLAYARVGDKESSERHLAVRGDLDAGVADPVFDAVLRLNPHTYARRGQDALQAGDLRLAVELLRTASQSLPEDAEIRMHLGSALARSGALGDAVVQYHEAVRLKPANPHAHYNLGTTLASLGRDEEALASLRRAVELHPEHPQALFNLAQALRRLGRDAEALQPLDLVLRLDPTHDRARLARARALARLGRCQEAVGGLEQRLEAVPGSRPLTALLARLLAACPAGGGMDTARGLRLAEQVFPEDGSAEYAATVAFVRAARGDWGGAVTWQRRALALLPAAGSPAARAALEDQLAAYESRHLSVEW